VADVDDEDEKFVVENAVVDAVVADADAVGVVAGEFDGAGAARMGGEDFNSADDSTIDFGRSFRIARAAAGVYSIR
jgi:hypothetical protein